jgi:broad specificity phosphatase PhoE
MRIVTSPLSRCVQTAALLGASDATREPRIIEMDWGEWEGRTLAELREELGDAMTLTRGAGWIFGRRAERVRVLSLKESNPGCERSRLRACRPSPLLTAA